MKTAVFSEKLVNVYQTTRWQPRNNSLQSRCHEKLGLWFPAVQRYSSPFRLEWFCGSSRFLRIRYRESVARGVNLKFYLHDNCFVLNGTHGQMYFHYRPQTKKRSPLGMRWVRMCNIRWWMANCCTPTLKTLAQFTRSLHATRNAWCFQSDCSSRRTVSLVPTAFQ